MLATFLCEKAEKERLKYMESVIYTSSRINRPTPSTSSIFNKESSFIMKEQIGFKD